MTMTMWNQFDTKGKDGLTAEVTEIKGYNGDSINAYYARPAGAGPFPGIVLVHHLPGWDEFYRETTRRFAHHGYLTICPNLYSRAGAGSPDDVAAKVRGEGGVSDDSVVGDCQGAADFLRAQASCNGKVGIIGSCSGGRQQRPVNPIEMTKDLNCPILGIFGNDDQNPAPDAVNQHEAELKKQGKNYEFHRYDGAGQVSYESTHRHRRRGKLHHHAHPARLPGHPGLRSHLRGQPAQGDC
jgi:carboxymethylenebutenolidase